MNKTMKGLIERFTSRNFAKFYNEQQKDENDKIGGEIGDLIAKDLVKGANYEKIAKIIYFWDILDELSVKIKNNETSKHLLNKRYENSFSYETDPIYDEVIHLEANLLAGQQRVATMAILSELAYYVAPAKELAKNKAAKAEKEAKEDDKNEVKK